MTFVRFADFCEAWQAAMWRASWQGALAVGLVWAICRAYPKLPPRVSCWLWRIAFLKMALALLPLGTLDLPWLPHAPSSTPSTIASAPAHAGATAPAVEASGAREATFAADAAGAATDGQAVAVAPGNEHGEVSSSATSTRALVSRATVLFCLWVVMLALFVSLVVRRFAEARRSRRDWRLITDRELLLLNERLSREMGLFQPPLLFESDACRSPAVFGALRTAIILPSTLAARSDPASWQMILAHEMAHIRRGDLLGNWYATIVSALFFFHPAAWLALRETRLWQEIACDELATRQTVIVPADYGRMLLELATGCPLRAAPLVSVGVVESFELFLKRRLSAMKNFPYRSKRLQAISYTILVVAAAGLLPWRLVARADTFAVARTETSTSGEVTRTKDEAGAVNVTTKAGPYTLSIERVERVSTSGHDEFPNGFPMLAGMQMNPQTVTQEGKGGSGAAGGLAGGFGETYNYKHPNLILHMTLKRSKSGGTSPQICAVYGDLSAKDDQGRKVDGSRGARWMKLLVDSVDYDLDAGHTAIHLALPAKSKNAESLSSVDGDLLVADGTVEQIEFTPNDFDKPTSKKVAGVMARLDNIARTGDGIEIEMAVSPPAGPRESKLERLQQGADLGELMKQDMLRFNPGRVTVVVVDGDGRPHYGKTSQQFDTGRGGSRSFAIGTAGSGPNAVSTWTESGESNGVKWTRSGGDTNGVREPETGFVKSTYRFPSLPSKTEIKSIQCVVTTCLSEPKVIPFHFEDVPLPK